jgi:hypothetical protein
MEWLLGDRNVLSANIEYQLKRAITFDPTVGTGSNVYWVSRGCFPWVTYGIATL